MKILAFAYACEPGKGSEPGAGWMWARLLGRLGETWVITRTNNRESIKKELPSVPERQNLHFVFVDLPRGARFWKRGQRGVRLYYLFWQLAALREAKHLQRQEFFDVVWHLTLANAWLGSLAPLAGRPFVYGPVGGGVSMPWSMAPLLGIRGTLYELLRLVARWIGRYLNPLARLAWRRASLILVQNPETCGWLPRRHRSKAHVFPNVLIEETPNMGHRETLPSRRALFVGRLLPWKGAAMALRALPTDPPWRLLVCGDGPDEKRLRRLARRLRLLNQIEFLGWLPRPEVLALMTHDASVLLLPSLHEEASWVVAEGLSAGLPIVCLERGGPPVIGGPAALSIPIRKGCSYAVGTMRRALTEGRFPERSIVTARAEQITINARLAPLAKLLAEHNLSVLPIPATHPRVRR